MPAKAIVPVDLLPCIDRSRRDSLCQRKIGFSTDAQTGFEMNLRMDRVGRTYARAALAVVSSACPVRHSVSPNPRSVGHQPP
jgi:hypothetical protein